MAEEKTCFFCKNPAPSTFDHVALFKEWSDRNGIISPDRSRFDGVRERLLWAATEGEHGAHPACALKWAVGEEGYGTRYPA